MSHISINSRVLDKDIVQDDFNRNFEYDEDQLLGSVSIHNELFNFWIGDFELCLLVSAHNIG